MKSTIPAGISDIQDLRAFLDQLPPPLNLGDLEEQIQIPDVRSTLRLWGRDDAVTAVAYVDSGNNLRFNISPGNRTEELEREILEWAMQCMRERNSRTGQRDTLDASCHADDSATLNFLLGYDFKMESVQTLEYSRSLLEPIPISTLPPGFALRCAAGEAEVDTLVALHRAAFGTDNMTVEERLAILRAPGYEPELDLLLTTLDGDLCAFCICRLEAGETQVGYTDPIGVHKGYQRRGLGKIILATGLRAVQARGATIARLGTSSENLAMQRLAESMGFSITSKKLWFSRVVDG